MRLRVMLCLFVLLSQTTALFITNQVAWADASTLEITELLVQPAAPQTDAHDEFVEIYNPTAAPIDLAGYVVKTGASLGTKHVLAAKVVPAGSYVVLTSDTSKIALANDGGSIALFSPTGDPLGATISWPKATPGSSWMRKPDDSWAWTTTPTPGADNQLVAPTPKPTATATPAPGQGAIGAAEASSDSSYAEVELNELFPDPAAPLTDAADEFIELYNPNDVAVDLSGYVIKTGASLSTKHTLKGLVPAGGYLALKSAITKIALANDGSSVALYDPSGTQLGPTITYPKAPTGDAWARSDSGWSWTTEPTPGLPNILAVPPISASSASKSSTSSSKAKTSAAKSSKATKTKATSTTKPASASSAIAATATSSGGHWLLFGLAGLTIGYVIYEFRYDLRNFYYRLRGYPGSGGAFGKIIARRRSHRVSE